MLSKEEKKAIEFLKEIVLEFEKCNSEYVIDKDDKYGFLNSFKVVINVIEKQQKEIEELKSKYKDLFFQNFELWEKSIFPKQTIEKEYISKDKIRELIKKYRIINKEILALQELLEEN